MAQMFERDTAAFIEDVVPGSAANEDVAAEPVQTEPAEPEQPAEAASEEVATPAAQGESEGDGETA